MKMGRATIGSSLNFIDPIARFITNPLNMEGIKPEKAEAGCELNTACPGRMNKAPHALLTRRTRPTRSTTECLNV
jgi:hypothetical protein